MNKKYDYLCKIILIGDSGIGKSSIIERFADNNFHHQFVSTIGVDFKVKTIKIDDKLVKIQAWDVAGQERFRSIVSVYYKGCHGIVVIFDITNKNSFKNVKTWLHEVDRYIKEDVPKILIGNKSDLINRRRVSFEEANLFAESLCIKYIETSAKDNINIDDIFYNISKNIINTHKLINNNNNNIILTEGQQVIFDEKKQSKCC